MWPYPRANPTQEGIQLEIYASFLERVRVLPFVVNAQIFQI